MFSNSTKTRCPTSNFNQFWNQALENGGWWETTARSAKISTGTAVKPAAYEPPQLDGNEDTYPFHLQPYASQSFIDGRHANIPWLQEMPEVLPTARWGSWVEINPQTAERLGIREGDLLAVASAHGKHRGQYATPVCRFCPVLSAPPVRQNLRERRTA